MVKYDFDKVIDRHGSGSIKYDSLDEWFGCNDITPLWIADMDFESCPAVTSALRARLTHPVLGYANVPDSYWQAIAGWLSRRHGVEVSRAELAFVAGVVRGVALAVNFFTEKGDKVLIQPPVYHPFRKVVEGNGRKLVTNPLIEQDGTWRMDIEGLRKVVEREHPRLMILCNPHNPIGLQWDEDTLCEVAEIASANDMLVVSDEIHGDLMLDGRRHVAFVSVSDQAAKVGIALGAPSKTFNIPGMASSWFLIPNAELRGPFYNWLEVNEFCTPDVGAAIAAESAYNEGEEWLDQLLEYLQGNIAAADEFFAAECPKIKVVRPEASFLIWLDCRELGLSQQELIDFFLHSAHIALNDGEMFGHEGRGFMRMNIAMPRALMLEALKHISDAYKQL